ncbi:MAG: DUF427 domain-containing protein [Planctomycetota bacterium]
MHPKPDPIGPGQESVWDFPRPAICEPTSRRLRVEAFGRVIAETSNGYRVLETSHPPVYYFPPADVDDSIVQPGGGGSFCEWKGSAKYFDLVAPIDSSSPSAPGAAWSYPGPTKSFEPMKDFIAFYAGLVDRCMVDDYLVTPQPGGFYGGWITPDVVGPFKGIPGSRGW